MLLFLQYVIVFSICSKKRQKYHYGVQMPRTKERESKFEILTVLRIIMDFLEKLRGNLSFSCK